MAYKYERKNRNIRLSDFEWEAFKDFLGADWLRDQIRQAAQINNRKPPAPTTKE